MSCATRWPIRERAPWRRWQLGSRTAWWTVNIRRSTVHRRRGGIAYLPPRHPASEAMPPADGETRTSALYAPSHQAVRDPQLTAIAMTRARIGQRGWARIETDAPTSVYTAAAAFRIQLFGS